LGSPEDFAVALAAVEQAIDWEALGACYCHEGGESFFPPEQVEALREAGLVIAGALGEELGGRPGRSLYVGAAVAELLPMLVESLVLGREVIAINLEGPETRLLDEALQDAESATGLRLPRIGTGSIEELEGRFDHAWVVSVFNDPEAFPALHDALYGRRGELATGQGDLVAERARAEALAGTVLARLEPRALLCTTDEELPLWRPVLARTGRGMRTSREALLTAVVGDPLRFLQLGPA
jgi:hypothetical protein